MCGRFEIHSPIEIIAKLFGIDPISIGGKSSYNIAPSQDIAIIKNDGRKNLLAVCRWGFVPAWSRELRTGYPMINARAETVATNATFRDSFANQRCLVPADGFYEWKNVNRTKIPYYARLTSGEPIAFAGLYSSWTLAGGDAVCTATIITTDANELLAPIHDRMPVILDQEDFPLWLDPAVHDKTKLLPLLKPYPSSAMELYPVTDKVNSYKYDDPENIRPVSNDR